jgi:hypothetical protein
VGVFAVTSFLAIAPYSYRVLNVIKMPLITTHPINPQLLSPLLRLPGELRNKIYAFALTTPDPITDPSTPHILASKHNSIPPLGVSLLRTCRLVYTEASLRPLYAANRFRFTTVTYTHHFLTALSPALRDQIHDLEIDVRDIHAQNPRIDGEWTQYLSASADIWAQKIGSLRADTPGLRVLRLNFGAWPRIGVRRRHLWDILRRLVLNLEGLGLERVVLIGASRGAAIAKIEPWSPVHYVGADYVGGEEDERFDLVGKMWEAVGNEGDEKVVRWSRNAGAIELEVVLVSHLRRTNRLWVATPVHKAPADRWPGSGHCNLLECQQRNG